MIYLEEFSFPSFQFENDYLADAFDYYRNAFLGSYRTDYYMGMVYPFNVLGEAELIQVAFKPITIFYGSNGAGKSTAINVIAEKLGVIRTTPYNSSSWMNRYVNACSCKLNPEWESRMDKITNVMTSDDVFHTMLDARKNSEMQQLKSQALRKEFFGIKYGKTPKRSLNLETREGIEEFRELNATKKKTTNRFLTDSLGKINRGYSNGENGLMYQKTAFRQSIRQTSLNLFNTVPKDAMPSSSLPLILHSCCQSLMLRLLIWTHLQQFMPTGGNLKT